MGGINRRYLTPCFHWAHLSGVMAILDNACFHWLRHGTFQKHARSGSQFRSVENMRQIYFWQKGTTAASVYRTARARQEAGQQNGIVHPVIIFLLIKHHVLIGDLHQWSPTAGPPGTGLICGTGPQRKNKYAILFPLYWRSYTESFY